MFKFLKKKKKQEETLSEEVLAKAAEKSAAFFKADREARKAAGLEDKSGSYTFTCPNCGSECRGEWIHHGHLGNIHGRTDCFTCNIHLMV